MKLFLDESVPKIIKDHLTLLDLDLVNVDQLNLSGRDDETVLKHALKLKRVFVTVDLRFVNKIVLLKKRNFGIILLRYTGKVPNELIKMTEEFFKRHLKRDLKNTLVVIDKEKFRIRKLEIET